MFKLLCHYLDRNSEFVELIILFQESLVYQINEAVPSVSSMNSIVSNLSNEVFITDNCPEFEVFHPSS